MERTELSSLGEFGLIDRISKNLKYYHKETLKGIGDDAAVLDVGGGQALLTSTDMLIEGIHFDLAYTPLKHLGYKSISVNVSDIAAMNALPLQVTISIAISNRFSAEAIDELYVGIRAACENFQADLVGGDTTSSPSGLVISVGINGLAQISDVVYRSTAKPKDLVCVSGDLGGALLGLHVLQREKQVFIENPELQPELEDKDYIVQRQLKPEARTDLVHEFRSLGIKPTSMIDISDGLASELLHLCNQSNTGARIFEDKLPIAEETLQAISEFNLSSTACVLNGGEDYELLFTIEQGDFDKIRNHPDISVIGYMTDKSEGVNLVTTGEKQVPVTAQGWIHFKS